MGAVVNIGGARRGIVRGEARIGGVQRRLVLGYIGTAAGPRKFFAGGITALPQFSGEHRLTGDCTRGELELLSSGTLTLADGRYDIFLAGGGASGAASCSELLCGGGGGGYTCSRSGQRLAGEYYVKIGDGGAATETSSYAHAANPGAATTAFGLTASGGMAPRKTADGGAGGDGGSGGAGGGGTGGSDGSGGQNSTTPPGGGQGRTTRAFGEPTGQLYAGGGGGAGRENPRAGGAGGGGAGGTATESAQDATPNTGGGGGGVNSAHGIILYSGRGANGSAIIRWGVGAGGSPALP